jgi:hypothetical protein
MVMSTKTTKLTSKEFFIEVAKHHKNKRVARNILGLRQRQSKKIK